MPEPRYQISIDGAAIDPALLSLVSRVEVRESDSEPSYCAIRMNLVQEGDGTFHPIDDDVFVIGAKLGFVVEVPGGASTHFFEGYITHLRPHFESVESNSYFEILAVDAAVLMNAGERTASYPDVTDADAVKEVFDRYGFNVSVTSTNAMHEEQAQLLMQRSSDWRFVQKLARRNGFICHFETDPTSGDVTAKFGPRDVTGTPQADLTLLRDGSNLKWLDLQFVGTGPAHYEGSAYDPLRKKTLTVQPSEQPALQGGKKVNEVVEEALTGAGAEAPHYLLRDASPLEAAIEAESAAASSRARFGIEARGEVDTPLYRGLLRARKPVLIKGVGRAFAGTYWVSAVRTSLEEGTINQTFVAERDAYGLAGGESFGGSAEEKGPE